MTPNGKLDQRALPAFDAAQPQPADSYMAPRDETEAALVEIWAEVLKTERIGVRDNFFEWGGHSLLAAQVVARVRKHMGVEIPARTVFEEPTIAAMAIAVTMIRTNGGISRSLVFRRSPRLKREELQARPLFG